MLARILTEAPQARVQTTGALAATEALPSEQRAQRSPSRLQRLTSEEERVLLARGREVIHAILDKHATHKRPKVPRWLANHPRPVFRFSPTSASWLNAVESFFSVITRRRIRRGVFRSAGELEAAIRRYIHELMPDGGSGRSH